MKHVYKNVPEDAVFAMNSEMWPPGYSIGTDGGYWIPFLTGQKTTSRTMLTIFSEETEGVSDLPKRMQTFRGQRTELDAL
jgi:hypothetical protein